MTSIIKGKTPLQPSGLLGHNVSAAQNKFEINSCPCLLFWKLLCTVKYFLRLCLGTSIHFKL